MRLVSEMERPLIGVTTMVLHDGIPGRDRSKYFAQTVNCSRAIHEAGGTALFIPQMEDPESPVSQAALDAACDAMDGFLLAGGPDVRHSLYTDEEPHPATESESDERDQTELRILRHAEQNNKEARYKPVLAICRGLQLLNVAKGGSLLQHIPDLDSDIDHFNKDMGDEGRLHRASVERSSALGKLVLPGSVEEYIYVNSFHHQGVERLGRDLRISARADDGGIEAIETTNEEWFALGVQWHPESMNEVFRKLFEAFVDVARADPIQSLMVA